MSVTNPVNCAHGSSPNQARSRGEDQLTDNEMIGTVKTREGLNSRVGRRSLGKLCSRAQAACIFYRCYSGSHQRANPALQFKLKQSSIVTRTCTPWNTLTQHRITTVISFMERTQVKMDQEKKSSNRSYNLKLYIRAEENTPEIKTYSAWSFATRHCLRYSGCFMLTIALHEHYNNILAWQMKKLRHKESEVLQTVCDDQQGEAR